MHPYPEKLTGNYGIDLGNALRGRPLSRLEQEYHEYLTIRAYFRSELKMMFACRRKYGKTSLDHFRTLWRQYRAVQANVHRLKRHLSRNRMIEAASLIDVRAA